MIVVRRIAGESYDLVTGKEQPKALVLSNGHSEVFVPINEETVLRVIQLMVTSPQDNAADMSGATFTVEDPPSPAETHNPALRVAPPPDESREYDDPETGTVSI
jgi:hypothetical protein